MSDLAEIKKEKVFEYYPNFPPEVQMMVIEEMRVDDRCRFTRCSKMSNKQAKSSKQFISGLKMFGEYEDCIDVHVRFNHYEDRPTFGYTVRFGKGEEDEESEKMYMIYLNANEEELWKIELCPSTDLLQLALQTFKDFLGFYQNTIKELSIFGFFLRENWNNDFDLRITSLKSLESLCVDKSVDLRPFFSALRHPLRDLEIDGNPTKLFKLYSKEMYQIKRKFVLEFLRLNKQQFLRLAASTIMIGIGKLTENDIFEIIKLWQNGAMGEKSIEYSWHIEGSKFDVKQFVRLFGARIEESAIGRSSKLEIKHNVDPTKTAKLSLSRNTIEFSVKH